jgi:hypothetical protein
MQKIDRFVVVVLGLALLASAIACVSVVLTTDTQFEKAAAREWLKSHLDDGEWEEVEWGPIEEVHWTNPTSKDHVITLRFRSYDKNGATEMRCWGFVLLEGERRKITTHYEAESSVDD